MPWTLPATVAGVLDRWPSAGLAVGVVRNGSLEWFLGHGVADSQSRKPVTKDTVFRIGSITKTVTAVAVLQLWERGLVDLDAPANEYLRAFRLVPAKTGFRPATVRHLLTHTAGVGYWRRLSDLLQPGVGSGNRAGRPGPSLADYYRAGLPVEVEPGTRWGYTNHGFAALGQLVEDVSGQPLADYLREHIFDPLGMDHTDLVRSSRVRARLATGYVLGARGLRPVADREVVTAGACGIYSTTADMARYVAALLQGGSGEHGPVLKADTLAAMFQPQFQLDPRAPGWGLGFELGNEGGHRLVRHSGIVSGFLSDMVLAPNAGLGVVVFSNTGGLVSSAGAPELLAPALLRRLLGLPDSAIRADLPPRPERWSKLCGWYSPDPGPVANLFVRAAIGAGCEVTVDRGQLLLKPLIPVPALRRGLRLYPDDPQDPQVFRVDLSAAGKPPTPVVFSRDPEAQGAAMRLLMLGMCLRQRPAVRNPRPWLKGALAAGTAALAIRRGRHRRASG